MAGGEIYLREKDGRVPMTEARYDADDVLPKILADYPDLLAGDQMRPSEPRAGSSPLFEGCRAAGLQPAVRDAAFHA